jgi:uncharacterized peroxidase-related enzyme
LTRFVIHTIDSAPEGSKATLEQLRKEVGFLPNLAATMAESPAMLAAFTTMRSLYGRTSFTGIEREVIALAAQFENACTYCMAAHSTFAAMHGAPEEVIESLRTGRAPADDPRLAALSTFTRRVIHTRGAVTAGDIDVLLDAGFERAQVLEVFVGIGMANLAAQMHHVCGCPVDAAFAPRVWAPPTGTAVA